MIVSSHITRPFRSLLYGANGVFDIEAQWDIAIVSRGMDRYGSHFMVQKGKPIRRTVERYYEGKI